jgi:hypothetical protein
MDRVEIRRDETGPEGPQDNVILDDMVTEDEEQMEAPQERPDWLPEKFNSPEEMAKAYVEAEKKISSGETAEYEEDEEPSTGEDEGEYFDSMDDETVAPYTQEFNSTGELSEESYKEISDKFGIPRQMAEAYVQGQQAIQQNMVNEIMDGVGGKDNYVGMIQWGQNNFSPEEQQTFDDTISSGDMERIKLAVSGVWARMQQDRGTRGKLIQGNVPSNSGNTYQSIAEVTEAMRDPRYKKDPAYRNMVQDRLKSSNVI